MAFGKSIRNADWDSAVASKVDDMTRSWRSSWWEFVGDDYSYEMMDDRNYIKGRMLDPYNGIVSYVCDSYGPGFNSFKRSINMNIQTGEIVRESDLFRPGYRTILRSLLLEYLPEKFRDQDMEYRGGLEPSSCFYITKMGVTYLYPQGQLGSMADGVIEVTIPWSAFTLLRDMK